MGRVDGPQSSIDGRIRTLDSQARALGLVWPSERTSKLLTVLVSLCEQGGAQAMCMPLEHFAARMKYANQHVEKHPQLDARLQLAALPTTLHTVGSPAASHVGICLRQ